MERTRRKPRLAPRVRWIGIGALALIAVACAASAQTTPASPVDTLSRIQAAGRIRIGYRIDARPFAYRDGFGAAVGYSITLCDRIADAVKSRLRLPQLTIDWVPLNAADRFRAVSAGTVDMLCGADTITLARRGEVAFSTPIFPGGIGALLRADAPARLRDVLSGHDRSLDPTWRASASRVIQTRAFAAVSGTVAAPWLQKRLDELHIITNPTEVDTYRAGIDALLERRIDALFGERAILLETARHEPGRKLVVLDRLFTYGPLALTLPPNDERFHLLVDRTIAQLYADGRIAGLYTTWFGEPDASAVAFFKWSTVPD
jgi:ABC-type amino acid transport substrate-binding protein